MLRGLYTSASGMLTQWSRMDVVANNLANVNTPGFKKDVALVQAFPQILVHRTNDLYLLDKYPLKLDMRPEIGTLGTGAQVEEVRPILSQGSLKQTDAELDIAIDGDGFFTVEAPNGIFYTRDGSFKKNSQGYLVNDNGQYILGLGGRINVGNGKVAISETGGVYVNGDLVDTLRVTTFQNLTGLEKMGHSLWNGNNAGIARQSTNFKTMQGYLEQANSNVITEMVEMIKTFRVYEANQRMITTQDNTLELAIGRVAEAV